MRLYNINKYKCQDSQDNTTINTHNRATTNTHSRATTNGASQCSQDSTSPCSTSQLTKDCSTDKTETAAQAQALATRAPGGRLQESRGDSRGDNSGPSREDSSTTSETRLIMPSTDRDNDLHTRYITIHLIDLLSIHTYILYWKYLNNTTSI